jgi:hypothetical protein
MQHPIKVMLVQETFTARTPQMVLAVLVIITVPQTQAKIIMQGTATTTTLPRTTLATTTLDTDITPTQHHITEEITTPDTDIMPETQDITLVHIHNQQEHHPPMLARGHPQQTQPTYIMHPTQRHTHLSITLGTTRFLQRTTMLDSPAPTL